MTLVVDASVAFKWFVPEEGDAQALALLEGDQDLIAPDLIFTEVANAMWVRLRRIDGGQAACLAAQTQLKRILRETFPINALVPRAIEIAYTIGDSVYDSVYLALCEREQSVLITADDRLIANAGRTAFASLARRLA